MKIVWDEPKRQANIGKHGFDFADLTVEFFLSATIIRAHSERRAAIGTLKKGTVVTIYMERGTEALSVISLRSASKKKRQIHEGI